MPKKLTYEYVYNYFKEHNCELLEKEYVNNSTKMKYKCKCNNYSYIAFGHFQNGKRCMKCSGNEKLTYEYVYDYFKEQNCELLEMEYKNNRTKMKYKCKCNNDSSISFDNFRAGYRCMKCSGNEKLTYKYVYNYFKEQNCKLLEKEYINSNTKMNYKCKCNNNSSITWDNFKQGYRCIQCGYDKQEKSLKRYKDYILPSGEIRRIQGYEHLALDELVKIYKEDDIITSRSRMPKIIYKIKNKEYRYYPDIWIKSENKIIEVKSTYIYKIQLVRNILKSFFTRKLGFNFEFWIYKDEKNNDSKFII